jgi:putative transposase
MLISARIFGWIINWRTGLLTCLLVVIVISGLLLPMNDQFLAGWWVEQQQGENAAGWRVVRRSVSIPRWWQRIYWTCRWGWAGAWLGVSVWVALQVLAHPAPRWMWLCLFALSYVTIGEIGWLLAGWSDGKQIKMMRVSACPSADMADSVDVTIDLEPLLAELGDLSPTSEEPVVACEALTARLERIQAECYQHPVAQALIGRIEAEVQQLVKQLIEEALVQELDEHLGFGRYERTGEAKPAEQHRSGTYPRGLRTAWGEIEIQVPKLRRGNKDHEWQVIKKYERSFGPWLDAQLHLYVLGLSQRDLQEILHLSFGQVMSIKAIEHLTSVAQKEMEAFRRARLDDTPPVILVDGVNITLQCSTGTYGTNKRGQRRQIKRRERQVLLAALGVWSNKRYRIIYFEVVEQEDKANWKQFFEHLDDRGLDPNRLQLIVGDGRKGLHGAAKAAFPQTVRYQRCIFHKLKNLADNLHYKHLSLNPELPYREARKLAKETRARAILQDAVVIYANSDLAVIQRRLVEFQMKWASIEPLAVRRFVKDFNQTLNYLRVPFPHKKLIRTTNRLERFFREFQRLYAD